MSFSARLTRFIGVLSSLVLITTAFTGTVASANPAPGLCSMNTSRSTVPGDYPVDACIDSAGIVLRNTLPVPIDLALTGDTGDLVNVSTNLSIPADLTRFKYADPLMILPGDIMRVPVGTGAASVSVAGTDAGGFYAEALTLTTFIPVGPVASGVKAAWGRIATMISEISSDYGQYANCIAGKNWIVQLGCRALLVRNVTFAVGRGVVTGSVKGVLALVLTAANFLKWADAEPGAIAKIIEIPPQDRAIALAAAANQQAVAPPTAPGRGGSGGITAPGGGSTSGAHGSPTVQLAQGPAAPSGYRYAVTLVGFSPDTSVTVICYDSVSLGGFYTFQIATNGSGGAATAAQCYSGDGPDHWVVANGVESNHVAWGGGGPSTQAPPPPTYTEQQGHYGANTFTNYQNASGMGPKVPAAAYVQISCKVYAPSIGSASPDGYWYRIASSPWNNQYYAVANTFMNGDPWGGPYAHNTDFNIPNC
jgi:hypothetical protein